MRLRIGLFSSVVCALAFLLVVQHVSADSKPPPAPRPAALADSRAGSRIPPSPALQQEIRKFIEQDRTASFNYYLGHVDSFSAKPKATVPGYALATLRAGGLSTEARANEQLTVTTTPKPSQNLDANFDRRLPLLHEKEGKNGLADASVIDDSQPEDAADKAIAYKRVKPPIEPPEHLWAGPGEKERTKEAMAAKPILLAFLQRSPKVFELGADDLQTGLPGLNQIDYSVGRYARKAVFEQSLNSEPIIGGRMIVLFDRNWNVTAISRMIATREKLSIPTSQSIDESVAANIAVKALAKQTKIDAARWKVAATTRGIDPVRQKRIWVVNARVTIGTEADMRVKLDAATGAVLNISDNIDRYTDAQVRRWRYSNGNLEAPVQAVDSNFYTRDDNTLVHDFFHIVNDERGGGDPQESCCDTTVKSLTYEEAYRSSSGSSYVRPTRRSDRDFTYWDPSEAPGTFSESNSYFWARYFFQWVKGSISDLGELPASESDYAQVVIIANGCEGAGASFSDGGQVTTADGEGEGLPVIRLPEKCRSTNDNCTPSDYTGFETFTTCEGDGCSTPPSVIHHEINHFLLKRYYGVSSGIDCGAHEELKLLHEGILGSSVPQAFWHAYYGVGYNPLENFLYKADYDAGLVHASNTSRRTMTHYPCDDSKGADFYSQGRVAGQVMWEIYHGQWVVGSLTSTMPRPSSDREFLALTYWAAELVSASTLKDRYEMANRVMELAENYVNVSSTGKTQWCTAWEEHELRMWINPGYCN